MYQTREKPWLIAHRGFSAAYPENTQAAFEAALALPIDGIELDIQLSRDRVPLIYHDRSLRKIGGGPYPIRNRDWAALSDLAIAMPGGAPPQRLPLFDEVLEAYGGRCRLLLEIKRREPDRDRFRYLMDRVIEGIRRHGLTKRSWILCYDSALLEYGYRVDPDQLYVLNQDRGRFLDDADFLFAYSVNIKGLTPDFVERAHRAGKPVLTFTCNTDRRLRHARECGVDGIMSDDPEWLGRRLTTVSRTVAQ